MLRTRIKRRAADQALALRRLDNIEESITALGNEDLLDLADIFAGDTQTPLSILAAAEMDRRKIKL
jgi:hypothetical protein